MKLNVKAFALSAGIIWAAAVLIVLLVAGNTAYLGVMSNLLTDSYVGSSTSIGGAVIGGVEGFVDAGIGAAIFAWLYNKLA